MPSKAVIARMRPRLRRMPDWTRRGMSGSIMDGRPRVQANDHLYIRAARHGLDERPDFPDFAPRWILRRSCMDRRRDRPRASRCRNGLLDQPLRDEHGYSRADIAEAGLASPGGRPQYAVPAYRIPNRRRHRWAYAGTHRTGRGRAPSRRASPESGTSATWNPDSEPGGSFDAVILSSYGGHVLSGGRLKRTARGRARLEEGVGVLDFLQLVIGHAQVKKHFRLHRGVRLHQRQRLTQFRIGLRQLPVAEIL